MEQSTTNGKELSAEGMLSKHTGEEGIYLTHGMVRGSDALEAMEEYASQKDAQIQALSQEVEELKKVIEAHEGLAKDLNDKHGDLKIAGDKMAEALGKIEINVDNTKMNLILDAIQAKEEWEKINK